MADTDWLSLGATVLGGLLGGSSGSSGGTTTTSTNAADPRFNQYLYGTGGVLPSASNWYQNNSTGLNEQSLAGLNRQYSVANDPNTAQGYTNMQSLGSALMGGAVAGNPFTDGRMSLGSTSGLGQNLGATQQPTMGAMSFNNPANAAGSSTAAFTQPTYQTQNAGAASNNLSMLLNQLNQSGVSGSYGGSGGGSESSYNGGSSSGSGIGGIGALGGVDGGFSPSYYGITDKQMGYMGSLLGSLTGLPGMGLLASYGGSSLNDRDPTNPSGLNATNGMDAMSDAFGGYGSGGFGSGNGGMTGSDNSSLGGYGAGDPDGF